MNESVILILPFFQHRSRAASAAGGGPLRPDYYQGHQGDGGVRRVGRGGDQVPDQGVPG